MSSALTGTLLCGGCTSGFGAIREFACRRFCVVLVYALLGGSVAGANTLSVFVTIFYLV